MMKFLIPLSVVSILFFSCNTNKNTPNYADASFDVVIESSYGGKDEKSYEVIKSNSELEKAIQTATPKNKEELMALWHALSPNITSQMALDLDACELALFAFFPQQYRQKFLKE